MKNLDLNIKVLNEDSVEALLRNELQIKQTVKSFDKSLSIDEILKNELVEAVNIFIDSFSEGKKIGDVNSDPYLNKLFKLQEERRNIEISLLVDFLKIFPHRRKSMSLKYIGKQLGISVDALILWLNFENVHIVYKKHGKYVFYHDFINFMKKISQKDYLKKKALPKKDSITISFV